MAKSSSEITQASATIMTRIINRCSAADIAMINCQGPRPTGIIYRFVGGSPADAGARVFRSVMTPIDDELTPAEKRGWSGRASSMGFIPFISAMLDGHRWRG